MAYEIIRTKEFNNLDNNDPIKLLKYAILKKEDKYFVQLKLRNDSSLCISRFTFNYKTSEGKKLYASEKIDSEPNDVFFDRTLIEIPSEKFALLGFEKVYAKKHQTKEQHIQNVNYFKKHEDSLITFLLSGLTLFSFFMLLYFLFPSIGLNFSIGTLLHPSNPISIPLFFLLFLVSSVLLGNHIYKLDLKNMDQRDRNKKDLTILPLWISALVAFALFAFIMMIFGGGSPLLIIFIACLLAVAGVLIAVYMGKKKKYKIDGVLIERKHTWINVLGMVVFMIVSMLILIL